VTDQAYGIPHVGVDPFSDAFLDDPYPHHHALRDAGPVVWIDSIGAYGMARFKEVQAALKDWQRFSSGRGVGLSDFTKETPWRPPSLLLESDPPLHDRTRGLMNRIVSLGAIRNLRPAWAARAEALIDRLVAARQFDAVKDLAEIYPLDVFPDTVGITSTGRENLLPYAAATFNGFGPRNELYRNTTARAEAASAWVAAACRRENLAPGSWGAAVYEACSRGECSEEEAARLVRSFLSAGIDTTINGVGNTVLAFTEYPDQWDKLRAKPALLKNAFEEALRWDSTVQIFFRTTTCRVEMSGAMLPEGSKVLLFLAAANRDPLHWVDPERFDIERKTSGHVGFGFGIHQCLGQMVARLEVELLLEAMRPRVRALRRVGPSVRRLNNTLHALASLPVEVEPA
jgi:hypothetical protein